MPPRRFPNCPPPVEPRSERQRCGDVGGYAYGVDEFRTASGGHLQAELPGDCGKCPVRQPAP
jgi:hypothetical protein